MEIPDYSIELDFVGKLVLAAIRKIFENWLSSTGGSLCSYYALLNLITH